MANLWFYLKAGNKFGPVTARILRQLALDGEIKPTDLVSREGSGTWVDAVRVKGLFPPASPSPRTPATPPDDSPYALDVPSLISSTRTDPPEPEGEGKLELDAASRFYFTHPLGFVAHAAVMAIGAFILTILILKEPKGRAANPMELIAVVNGLFLVVGLGIYFAVRWEVGKKTACPRCNRWFSKLLIKSDAQVVGSREEIHTYTGQNAIRDRNGQVTGYIDEQRTMPVTVKTVVGLRKYRCQSCGHRWEVSDVGRVIM